MFSKRDLEGYLEIDHRESPGFTSEEANAAGLRRVATDVGKGTRAQIPVVNCSHCQMHIIMNPLRTRDRAYCPKCDRYICDRCEMVRVASGGLCKPFTQVVDEFMEAAAKGMLKHGA